MKALRTPLILLLLILCSYTIYYSNDANKEAADWKGSEIKNLITIWGEADMIDANSNGEKLYTYIESFGTDLKEKENPLYWQINSYKIKYYCKTVFTVDSLDYIIDVNVDEKSWNDK